MCDQQRLRPACAYVQSGQSLCSSLEYSMRVKQLTEHHLKFLNLKGGYIGSSEYTLFKIPHCWKSLVAAHLFFVNIEADFCIRYKLACAYSEDSKQSAHPYEP